MSAGGDATCWFVDGHDCRSCDEGGKECHENQNSKCFVVEHLKIESAMRLINLKIL